jgi:hypothetical protein
MEVIDSKEVHNYLQGFHSFIYFFRGEGGPKNREQGTGNRE